MKQFFSNIKGDAFGGITAGVVALPLALAFGVSSGYNFGKKILKECNCLDKSDPTFQNRVGVHMFAMKRP